MLYATGLNGTGSSQTVRVKATYIYPKFQAYSKYHDYENNIALLKLVKAFDMCDSKVRLLDIAPVRLDDDYKSCLIFGWQSTVAPTSKVLAKPVQYSKVLLNSWRVCVYMHEGNASYRNVFCTMIDDENGIRACAGNPGSPVVCEDQYQRMVLLGIASWSNFSLDCGGLPTYLGVSVFRSWMWDLIFGKRNMDQWETGTEIGTGACQRERHLDGIYGESNLQLRIHNYTGRSMDVERALTNGDDDALEDAYAMSWRNYAGKNGDDTNATKEITDVSKIAALRGKLEPPLFDHIDDYDRALADGGDRRATNYDVVRARDEQLSQYREIGRGSRDRHPDGRADSVEFSLQQERPNYNRPVKMAKTSMEPETDRELSESFDDLELVLPDGIDDFDRSGTATASRYAVRCCVPLATSLVFFYGNTMSL